MKVLLIYLVMIATSLNAIEIPQDKQKHIAAGLLVYGTCELINAVTDSEYINHEACISAVLVAGIGKEVYDSIAPGHTVDAMDTVATVAIPMVTYTVVTW